MDENRGENADSVAHLDARQARALTDTALVIAMRARHAAAWGEFLLRFGPLLEEYARRIGIPRDAWDVCVREVLEDEAVRLAARASAPPESLAGYLVSAVRHRWLRAKRAATRRARWYDDAARDGSESAEAVVRVLCSAHARRVSEGPLATESQESEAMLALARVVTRDLSDEDLLLLAWSAEGVPRREMAAWMGIGYEAARKRVLRLAHRLRDVAGERAHELTPVHRFELARILRRAGTAIPWQHRAAPEPAVESPKEAHDAR